MKDVNVVVLEGRLTIDAELKYTADGQAYCKFSIAVNGFKKDEVSYFNVTSWGKLAEICATYLKKGKSVIITGNLKQRRWKAEDGTNRSDVSISAQDVKFIGNQSKKDNNAGSFQSDGPSSGNSADDISNDPNF